MLTENKSSTALVSRLNDRQRQRFQVIKQRGRAAVEIFIKENDSFFQFADLSGLSTAQLESILVEIFECADLNR